MNPDWRTRYEAGRRGRRAGRPAWPCATSTCDVDGRMEARPQPRHHRRPRGRERSCAHAARRPSPTTASSARSTATRRAASGYPLDHRPHRRHAQLRPRHPALGHARRPGVPGRADRRRRRRARPGPDLPRPARRRRLPQRPPIHVSDDGHAGRGDVFYSSLSWFIKAGRRGRVSSSWSAATRAAARLRRLLRLRAGRPGLRRNDGRARRPRLGRGRDQADRRGGRRPLHRLGRQARPSTAPTCSSATAGCTTRRCASCAATRRSMRLHDAATRPSNGSATPTAVVRLIDQTLLPTRAGVPRLPHRRGGLGGDPHLARARAPGHRRRGGDGRRPRRAAVPGRSRGAYRRRSARSPATCAPAGRRRSTCSGRWTAWNGMSAGRTEAGPARPS